MSLQVGGTPRARDPSELSPQGRSTTARNGVLREIYSSGWVHGTSGKSPRRVSEIGMPEAEGERLYELVKRQAPRTTLEVGLAFGLSTLFICEALREIGGTRHIAIDPYQTSYWDGLGLENVAAAGFTDLVDFSDASSHRVLPRLEAEGMRLDLAFMDGNHLFDFTLLEFFYIDRMLRPGGLLIFDDLELPAVAKVVRFATANRGYTEESQPPRAHLVRTTGRRLRRLGRGMATLPAGLAFAAGSERRETLPRELPRPRRHGLGVLRKQRDDDRNWLFFRSF